MAAHAERCAEVARQGPNIGARRAVHLDIHVTTRLAIETVAQDLKRETGTRRAAQFTFSPARAGVGTLTVDLDGAHGGGNLVYRRGARATARPISSSVTPPAGVWSTSPSASSVEVVRPSRMVAV